jgi:hypothetical protein
MGSFVLRLATREDIEAIQELIPRSARELSRGFYSPQQIESAIRFIFGPDSALIDDGTYFVACEVTWPAGAVGARSTAVTR